jgi:hypothetical protein
MPSPVPDSLSAAAQAWQVVLHAVLQQKPSTQWLLPHSVSNEQDFPPSFPHVPRCPGALHTLSVAQAEVEQHTPSTQCPLAQSVPLAHV